MKVVQSRQLLNSTRFTHRNVDVIVVGNLINISFPIKNVNEVITLLP